MRPGAGLALTQANEAWPAFCWTSAQRYGPGAGDGETNPFKSKSFTRPLANLQSASSYRLVIGQKLGEPSNCLQRRRHGICHCRWCQCRHLMMHQQEMSESHSRVGHVSKGDDGCSNGCSLEPHANRVRAQSHSEDSHSRQPSR